MGELNGIPPRKESAHRFPADNQYFFDLAYKRDHISLFNRDFNTFTHLAYKREHIPHSQSFLLDIDFNTFPHPAYKRETIPRPAMADFHAVYRH